MSVEFSLGTDPEVFLVNKDDGFVSAIDVIGVNQDAKIRLAEDTYLFHDNVLAELNVKPAENFHQWNKHIRTALGAACEFLSPDYRLKVQASATLPQEVCEHDLAQVFGCSPEFSIYGKNKFGKIVPVQAPVMEAGNTFRSGGGHVHIGHEIASPLTGNPPLVVQLLDFFLGASAILIDHDPTSLARKKIYGGAGSHRVSDWGLEYRTLSNFWLASPDLCDIIYRTVELVLNGVVEEGWTEDIVTDFMQVSKLQEVINTGSREGAGEIFRYQQKRFLPTELGMMYLDAMRPTDYNLESEWLISRIKPALEEVAV